MKKILVVLGLLVSSLPAHAQNVKTFIPKKAPPMLPLLKEEISRLMPDAEIPWYFGGLIEQESCLSLTHSRCWDPTSQLLTKREQGLGFGQLTRTWNADGSPRFDTLADMRRAYNTELKDLSWDTLKDRPDLQMRTMILMVRKDLQYFGNVPDPINKYKFADSSYNGGRGDVLRARTKCSMTPGCDANIWTGHVDLQSVKSDKPLYGTRSAKFINNEHVSNIFELRMEKYRPFFQKSF